MSRATRFVVGLGDAVDALAGALRRVPREVRRTLAVRRYRRVAVAVALAYLAVYLLAIQDIAISLSGQYGRFASVPSIEVVPDWTERLFQARAPFLYEPVAAIYPLSQLAFFVSPGNILVGSSLGVLLGLNIALAAYARSREAACGRRRYAGVLGALPSLLLGFSCCAPTLILLLGTSVAAALMPAFIPLREYLFPASLLLMTLMLAWSGRRSGLAQSAAIRPSAAPRQVRPAHVPDTYYSR